MTRNISLPLVTRVEVIDGTGRAFTQRYEIAGATVSVQDEGRTIKVFVAEKQETPSTSQKPPFTALRDALNDTLNSAHEFLGEPATAGAALDAVIDRVRDAFTSDEGEKPAPADIPTVAELLDVISAAVVQGRELLHNPEFGGSVEDIIARSVHSYLRDRKD